MNNINVEGINKSIEEGRIVRIFVNNNGRGGVRIVRIEDALGKGKERAGVSCTDGKDGYLIAYGDDRASLFEALESASFEYLGKPHTGLSLAYVRHEAEDKLDEWILKGNKLWAEKSEDGKIIFAARTNNYETVVSTKQDTFEKAYDSLYKLVEKELSKK